MCAMLQTPRTVSTLCSPAHGLSTLFSDAERGLGLPRKPQVTKYITVTFDATDPLGEMKEREREKRRRRRDRQQAHRKSCEAMERERIEQEGGSLMSSVSWAIKSDEHDFSQKQPSPSEPYALPSEADECRLWRRSAQADAVSASPFKLFAEPMYVMPSHADYYSKVGVHHSTAARLKYCPCCGKINRSDQHRSTQRALRSAAAAAAGEEEEDPFVEEGDVEIIVAEKPRGSPKEVLLLPF
eukprot:TRINITY_DN40134_c1_g1_i1.p1 TRINITY_DN40134_c1_g1~~TRINITY_DN40134_c1_g1_i1.p1  ORF type:complete len:241 (-),score=41.88 TRINITY_DN40134_c1_g1_i1:560-1282(-)